MNIQDIEKAIGIPAEKWKARCYEISCAVVDAGLVDGKPVYGHYRGYIDEGSVFAANISIGFARHGWIRTKGGIIDVTRWVFECDEPYVFTTTLDDIDYDEGGNTLRAALRMPPPAFSKDDKEIRPAGKVTRKEWERLNVLAGGDGRLTNRQLGWVANTPVNELPDAKYVYGALGKLGLKMFIPYDNWHMVMDS
jgi:hypothetical protein